MKFTTEQLIKIYQNELDRIKRYFDTPKKETIERIENEIKELKNGINKTS